MVCFWDELTFFYLLSCKASPQGGGLKILESCTGLEETDRLLQRRWALENAVIEMKKYT